MSIITHMTQRLVLSPQGSTLLALALTVNQKFHLFLVCLLTYYDLLYGTYLKCAALYVIFLDCHFCDSQVYLSILI